MAEECLPSEELVSFQKNESDQAQFPLIENHLKRCTQCSQEFAQINEHFSLYAQIQLPEFKQDKNGWMKLKQEIQRESKPAKSFFFYKVAVAALALISAYLFLPQNQVMALTEGVLYPNSEKIPIASTSYQWSKNDSFQTKSAKADIILGQISCALAPYTKIQISNEHKIHLVKGTLYVDVIPGTPLKIVTNSAQAKVMGTSFLISQLKSTTEIKVYHGKVNFQNAQKNIILTKGQSSNSNSMQYTEHTQILPSWIHQPLLMGLRQSPQNITIELKNLTLQTLDLKRFSNTPNFLFHIKHIASGTEYQAPIFSKMQQNLQIPPHQTQALKIPKANVLKQKGLHEVTLIFQAQIQAENMWSGTIRSTTITVENK